MNVCRRSCKSSPLLLLALISIITAAARPAEPAPSVRILEGHQGSVMCLAYSPDEKTLATSSRDDVIHLWDPKTGKLERRITGHTGDVYCVAFSPKGDLLASGSTDRSVRLWNARTFEVIRTLDGHTDVVRWVAFSPDGKTLASAGGDKTIRLWDVQSGEPKKTLTGHTDTVKMIRYSPDGKTMVTASSDTTVRLWDAQSGEQKAVLKGHATSLEAVAVSPDGKQLASSSNDSTVRLWDAETARLTHTLKGHEGEVDSVDFTPDGKTVISGGKDKAIKFWDAKTGELRRTLTGHTGRVESLTLSRDGHTLVTGGGGGDTSVRLWDLTSVERGGELAQVRQDFSADPGWTGVNNRVEGRDCPTVTQDFGWSRGKIGGTVWASRTPAWYGMPLGRPLTFKDAFSATGKLAIKSIYEGYFGFFNHTRQEWRPWSSVGIRMSSSRRGEASGGAPQAGAQLWVDYMAATWQAGSTVTDIFIPADESIHTWSIVYDPDARVDSRWPSPRMADYFRTSRVEEESLYKKAKNDEPSLTREKLRQWLEQAKDQGLLQYDPRRGVNYWELQRDVEKMQGAITFRVDDGKPFKLFLDAGLRDQPVILDRFGLFNFQLSGPSSEFYLSDLNVNGVKIDLAQDPHWEGQGNHVTFVERDFHPKHDFGYSQTHWAGNQIGEVGGTLWRTEPIDPMHGYYGDDVGRLTLDDPISFSGNVCFVNGGTDAGMFIGFFNTNEEKKEITDEQADAPMDQTLGIEIEGPTRIGYYFSALCSPRREIAIAKHGPAFVPNRERHAFTFDYDPKANDGIGRVTVTLDGQAFVLDLTSEQRKTNSTFDRFGLMNIRRGGKYVTVYFDDLTYTTRRPANYAPVHHKQETVRVPYPPGGRKF